MNMPRTSSVNSPNVPNPNAFISFQITHVAISQVPILFSFFSLTGTTEVYLSGMRGEMIALLGTTFSFCN